MYVDFIRHRRHRNYIFVEYSLTCNISLVGLLFRQTRVKQHAKNITAYNKNTIRTVNKFREKKNTEYEDENFVHKICLYFKVIEKKLGT